MPAIETRTGAWIGRVIDDRYRIIEVLGEGGMGAVYVAEHLKLRKQVAVKTIRTEFADDAHLTERFVREALATGQIEHPHVVSAMDFGHLPEGGAYLVVQLVRGEALTKHLHRGPLAWPQVAELGAQIADALAAAHAAGIVHRDLKPDNILLEPRDGLLWAKVVDFGIARLSGDGAAVVTTGSEPLTRAGMVVGTPGYMAPEQALAGQVDGRTDLYALGVILWECCTGRRLWTGDSLTELFQRQLTTASADLRTAVPGTPPALAALIVQLLDPAPNKRPATPAIVRDELRSIARGEDLAAASMRRPMPGIPAAHTMVANVMTGEQPPPTIRAGGPWSLVLDLRTAVTNTLPAYEGAGRRVWWALGGGLLLMFVLLARCACGGDDTADADPESTLAVGRAPDAPPTPPPPGAAAKTDAKPEPEIPAAYAPHAEILAHEKDRKARKASAEKITGASESDKQSIPLYIRNLAWLEKNSGCEAKKAVLLKIEADADPRVIPALRILSTYPRDGCGFFGMKDCLECLRDDLRRVLGHFESIHPE
ncbi:MAG: serine/threonine protein kinase [Myxococcales bacterium]|nr:serine/threonine protein kinase [Myxococcales bacterium]